jgi:hypothetical protein
MLLLMFGSGASNNEVAMAISEMSDAIVLRIMSANAPVIDPKFRIVARPLRRSILAKSI